MAEAPAAQRLFFALWPDAALRAQLARVTRKLARGSGGRPVAPENFHITVAFLGPVTPERRACYEAAAGRMRASPFTLVLDAVGHFPRPRVLWLGASLLPEALRALVQALNAGLMECGFAPEPRPLHAHLTLARKVARWNGPAAFGPIPWTVRELALVESVTASEGAHYQVLRRWPLDGA